MPRRQLDNMRRAFDEICATNVIPNSAGDYELHITAEYSEETGKAQMRFTWGGAPFKPPGGRRRTLRKTPAGLLLRVPVPVWG